LTLIRLWTPSTFTWVVIAESMEHLGNGMEHRWGRRFQVNIPVHVS